MPNPNSAARVQPFAFGRVVIDSYTGLGGVWSWKVEVRNDPISRIRTIQTPEYGTGRWRELL